MLVRRGTQPPQPVTESAYWKFLPVDTREKATRTSTGLGLRLDIVDIIHPSSNAGLNIPFGHVL